jgi:hypothetical protein
LPPWASKNVSRAKLKTEVAVDWTDLTGHTMFADWTKKDRKKVPGLPVDRRTGISVIELGYSPQRSG